MEKRKDNYDFLELISRPAFVAADGVISRVNCPAADLLIEVGTPLPDILLTGQEELEALAEGCLHLTLVLHGISVPASVSRQDNALLFLMDDSNTELRLQSLALAARTLRFPLSNAMLAADHLISAAQKDPALKQDAARLNHQLHQILRLVSNMSDALSYSQPAPPVSEVMDAVAVFREIFEKAASLAGQAGIRIHYVGPEESVLCPLNAVKLERAIYNLISNAIKFNDGGTIDAHLIHRGNRLILMIRDYGQGIRKELLPNVYSRYTRQAGLEDFNYGIGLGMVLVRAAAAAHQGTVLIDQPPDGGTRVTLTLKVLPIKDAAFRSQSLRVDYTGGRDSALVELSEVLPADLYEQ